MRCRGRVRLRMAAQLTTCTFCGAGCGLYLETASGRITGVYPSMSHPTNAGRICVRGWNVHEVASSPDRLRSPMIRRGGRLEAVSWGEAFEFIARGLEGIRARHGAGALAVLNSPRCSNEESYLLQKLARGVLGTPNVDHGTGVYCHNSIHVLREMIGVAATTNSVAELGLSEVIVVDGVDLGRQLPTIGGWVIRAKLRGARLIVIDSRRHRVAEHSDFFMQLRPGTEPLLYGAMAKVLVDRGLRDLHFIRAHCQGYEALLERLKDYDLVGVAAACGVAAELIESAALAYGQARRAAILFSTGIESRDEATIQSMVNLALLTGNLGREGAGIYALTEQNNLQGVCDVGMHPNFLPGYRPVEDAEARASLERLWGGRLPEGAGCDARTVLSNRGRSPIRGLWLCRYDPVSTGFFGDAVRTLEGLELVVVQHLFLTGTAQHAHVVLPTTAFGEEEVTFTSTDRRIQLARRVIDPPPGPMPAWQQIMHVARSLGAEWKYRSSAEVMEEIGQAVPFYGGASHENLGRDYGRPWPCTKDKPLGTRFLFEDGIPAGRPFRFKALARPPSPEPDLEFPFSLLFGHSLYYWHHNVLIKHSETLKREYRILLLDYPEGFVELNGEDARRLGVRDGERIRLRARTGMTVAAVRVTPEVRAGTIFVPYFVRKVEQEIGGMDGATPDVVPVRVEKEGA
jgi:predicted molibdopterin-dependent oxidoreductase YjgC